MLRTVRDRTLFEGIVYPLLKENGKVVFVCTKALQK
jgi:hypothetical protein